MERITSRANERVKALAALCADGGARDETGLCVLHGLKLCREAVRLGLPLCELWAEEGAAARDAAAFEALSRQAGRVVLMSGSVCEKLTPQRTPQGFLATVRKPGMPPFGAGSVPAQGGARLLVLDGVQDPANVGGMLRTAAALGYGAAVLSRGCADPFSPKALRGSMGAALALPLFWGGTGAQTAAALQAAGYLTVAAALDRSAAPIGEIPAQGALALFIGSEGGGLPEETVRACGQTAFIPITGRVESLNAAAAAAIAMWELRR